MTAQQIWTDVELAAEWKCDLRLLQRMCRRGEVEAFKVGREWRVTDRAKRAHEDAQSKGSAA